MSGSTGSSPTLDAGSGRPQPHGLRWRLHRRLVWTYHRLPEAFGRRVFRTMVPTHVLGAAVVLERDDGRILLVRQPRADLCWALPGGVVDRNESPRAAAIREAREEVGLAVELVGEPLVLFEPERRKIHAVFRARCADGSAPDSARPTSPEIDEVRWVALEEARSMPQVIEGALEVARPRPDPT